MAAKKAKSKKNQKPKKVFGANGIFYTFPQGEQGPIEIRIDFSFVPPPENYYYADSLYVRLDYKLRMAVLSFGHRNDNTDKFSDRIDIAVPTSSLFGSFWTSTRPVEDTLDKVLEATKSAVDVRPTSQPDSETLTLFANTIFLAVGEGETTLDFYHLSPREVHLAKTQKANMQLQPTVRVIMSNVLTKFFFNALRPNAERNTTVQPTVERSMRAARTNQSGLR